MPETSPSSALQAGEGIFQTKPWGRYVAARLYETWGTDLRRVLAAWHWHLIIDEADESHFPLPRFAVWEGDTKTIRLFQKTLARKFPQQSQITLLACAHEMFHGIVAHSYQNLLPPHVRPPLLSHADEEIAAHAFAHACVENFCLTLEA